MYVKHENDKDMNYDTNQVCSFILYWLKHNTRLLVYMNKYNTSTNNCL